MSNKEANLKEKLRQALASTIRVISEDLKTNHKEEKIKAQINLISLSWII